MNRRPFIKLAVGASLASVYSKAQETQPEPKKLGWALVGLGSLSRTRSRPRC